MLFEDFNDLQSLQHLAVMPRVPTGSGRVYLYSNYQAEGYT